MHNRLPKLNELFNSNQHSFFNRHTVKKNEHSLIVNSNAEEFYQLIPDVIESPFTMNFTFDLAWLDQYKVNDIAASLIQRLHLNREFTSTNQLRYFDKIELRLCFPGKIIHNLISSGEFLNTHQTGTSNGASGSHDRATIEACFLEMPFDGINNDGSDIAYRNDDRLHFLRPKYVLCHNTSGSNIFGKLLSAQYGNFSAVLEDHVKHRSSFTYHDSLVPIESNETQTFYSTYQKNNPYEGQVYGHVNILEDVKFFYVNPAALVFEKNAIEQLKVFNKPIINSVTHSVIYSPSTTTLTHQTVATIK